MDTIKPWKIIVIIIAIAGLGFSVWKFMPTSSVPQTNGYMTVDIMTGQLYDIRKGKAKGIPLPAKNPDTGVRTLYPVNQINDTTWEIPSGFGSFLTEDVRKGSKLEDGKFAITVLSEEPVVFKLR